MTRIFRRAGGRIVEDLRGADFARRVVEVGGLVDDHRHVAGADADRRRAAGIGAAHIVLRAGGDHQIGRLHQRLGHVLGGRRRKDLNEVLRQADLLQFRAHVIDRAHGRLQAGGRGGDDDRVTPLDRHHRLVDRRSAGIGRGRDGANHADRLGVFDDAALLVFLDHADRFHPQQIAQSAEGLALLLDDLVGHVAELGVGDRQFRQLLGMLGIVQRPGERGDRLVGARLIGLRENGHGGAGAPHQLVDHRLGVGIHRRFHCNGHCR